MDLKELGDILVLNGGNNFKNRKFRYKRLEPDSVFKELDILKLSYSTMHAFEECMMKFVMSKFMDLGFFKTGEALFLGNLIHKFIEDLINEYQSGNLNFNNYNDVARSNYEFSHKMFDKKEYPTQDKYIETIFKHVMGRKTFAPDAFFDDISFIESIPNKRLNYVEQKKAYFQNAAKLMKQLFGIAHQINATKFYAENWINVEMKSLPIKFIGKIDLYFPFEMKGTQYIGLVDFKTGKKEYFNWDQMNYYALSFGEDQFPNIDKYFFDIKEGKRISYGKSVNYHTVYDNLYEKCSKINDIHQQYNEVKDDLKAKYTEKLEVILRKANKDEIYKTPCDIVMMVFDLVSKEFFKARNIADYHSNGGFACQFCDISSYCSIRK